MAVINGQGLMLPRSLNQQIDGMWQNRQDAFQALFDSFGAAREINNQRAPTCSGNAARKHAKGSMFQADGTHSLGDTRGLTVDDCFCRLRRDIAWSQPGATRGKNEVQVFVIAPFAQDYLNLLPLIGNDCTRADDGLRHLGHHSTNVFAASILLCALRTTIADGEYSNSNHTIYPFWFSILKGEKGKWGHPTPRLGAAAPKNPADCIP